MKRPSQNKAADAVVAPLLPQWMERRPESLDRAQQRESVDAAEGFTHDGEAQDSRDNGQFLALYYAFLENYRMTFLEFVKTRFIPEHVISKSPAGRRHYHAILKHILKPEAVDELFDAGIEMTAGRLTALPGWTYLDEVRLCDLSSEHVRSIISAALVKGYSVQTAKHIRNVIGTIVTYATKKRCFSGDNPAFQVRLPPMTRKPQEHLTLTQVRLLLEVMKSPEREVAFVALSTGLNVLEICGLQWKYVNLSTSPIHREGTIILPKSIAVKKQWAARELWDVRSNRVRSVGVSEPLLSLLENLRQRPLYTEADDFVFVSRTGKALWPANLQYRLKPLRRELGMPLLSWNMFSKAHQSVSAQLKQDFLDDQIPARNDDSDGIKSQQLLIR